MAFHSTRKLLVPLVVALVVLSASAGTVTAEAQIGGTVVVAEGETVDGLEVVAGTVVVRGTVEGDLSGTAGTIVVERTGTVTGDVSASTGSLRISGAVQGDVNTGAGSVSVGPSGAVLGEFNVGSGSVVIQGRIAGPATVGADTITVGSNAVLEQGLRYDANSLTVEDGATVSGEVVRDESISNSEFALFDVPDFLVFVYGTLVNLALGAILLVLFPGGSRRIAETVADRPLRSAGIGLATVVVVPLVLVLTAVTIIGIPLALLGAVLFGITAWAGLVYGRFALAAWALSRADVDSRWVALLVGVVGLGLVGAIPILGGLVDFVVSLLGLGAIATTVVSARRSARGSSPDTVQTTLEDADGRPA